MARVLDDVKEPLSAQMDNDIHYHPLMDDTVAKGKNVPGQPFNNTY